LINQYFIIDGEYKICLTITQQTFVKHDVKQVKAVLKFSNEYYKCNLKIY